MEQSVVYKEYPSYKVKVVHAIKNSYGYRVELIYSDGTMKTHQHSGFKKKEAAEEDRCIAIADLSRKVYLVNGRITVEDYLTHWLEDIIRPKSDRYNTYYSYRNIIAKHIVPVIGSKRMEMLNAGDITLLYSNAFYNKSESIARQIKAIMHSCLERAVREYAIAVNVSEGIRLPKAATKKSYHTRTIKKEETLTYEQVLKLIDGSKGTKIYLMVLFNAIMGLRCSEIIGLKYSDVDFVKRTLKVERQLGRNLNISKEETGAKNYTKQELPPKTDSGYRTIDIPDMVFEAILQERKKYEANRNRRKTTFQDLGYICCSSYGRPRGRTFHFRIYKKLLRELGLPDLRWHDLRHTAATMLLMEGFNPKAVSEIMGHAKEIVTVDTYGDKKRLAAIKLDKLDEYIASVVPADEDAVVNCSNLIVPIDDYIPC